MFRSAFAVLRRSDRQSLAASLLCAAALAGCNQFPSAAPTVGEFRADAPAAAPHFLVIDLDPAALAMLAGPDEDFAGAFDAPPYTPRAVLVPGDSVGVTLYDLGAVPLFGGSTAPEAGSDAGAGAIPAGAHGTTLPTQLVEADGTITIPFAGRVHVGGLTLLAASQRVVAALAGRATTPQAVVSLVGASLDVATVGGDVAHPAQVPLTLRGERILDALALAGGARDQPYNCEVQLVRHGRRVRIGLQRIVDDPAANLVLAPGDSLFVLHAPRSFLVLGAALKVSQYSFETERVSLAEAVAQGGGPSELTANISQVFLLRSEPPALVRRLLAGVPNAAPVPEAPVAVAYHVDLRHGGGYFLAQTMQMRDKDIVLMTNANELQLQKALNVIRTGIYYDFSSHADN